mmetsp:Transcript_37147/g.79985  ORF Transcript_37147/g.79985 Transcript_37147/m.79985 type:complete len:280 (+) Transcript_37147:982-1821(+)
MHVGITHNTAILFAKANAFQTSRATEVKGYLLHVRSQWLDLRNVNKARARSSLLSGSCHHSSLNLIVILPPELCGQDCLASVPHLKSCDPLGHVELENHFGSGRSGATHIHRAFRAIFLRHYQVAHALLQIALVLAVSSILRREDSGVGALCVATWTEVHQGHPWIYLLTHLQTPRRGICQSPIPLATDTSNLWDRGGRCSGRRCRGRRCGGGVDRFRKGTCSIQAIHPIIRTGFLRRTDVSRWDLSIRNGTKIDEIHSMILVVVGTINFTFEGPLCTG